MKMEALKKLGILGVSFGLIASPLAFAEMESGTEQEPVPQEETTAASKAVLIRMTLISKIKM